MRSGEELLSLESENTSDMERQNTIGKAMNSAPAMEENDVTHEKMMKFQPLLETSGERNLRSIKYQPDTWGMPMPLPGTDSVVSGAFQPLLDLRRGRKSVCRVT